MRIHVCLIDANLESRVNHNVFVEAAGAKVGAVPDLKTLVKFHRNCDAMQLAHDLAAAIPPMRCSGVDDDIRKVGMLNGANNKLFGNHWFAHGARTAIDENLHRRSSSMSVISLLLNMATEPQERSLEELSTNVELLGGSVVELLPLHENACPILTRVVVCPYGVLGTQA